MWYRVHSSRIYGILWCKSMPDPSLATSHSEETNLANKISNRRSKSTFFWACYQFWRFLPDLIAAGTGCLFANWKSLTNKRIAGSIMYIFIPGGFLALMFVLMLQRGTARFNISRWFLSIHPVATMGYASYALYLLQQPAFGFWAPYFYWGYPANKTLTEYYYAPKSWFWYEPLGKKMGGIIVLQIICWLIHKYYQDKFVPYVYGKLTKCCQKAVNTKTHTMGVNM